ncbi:unnamed protein product [Closterium sp. Naga37s-1]|nr:unnamed protein product [Closterium sp. Naga37s-1]
MDSSTSLTATASFLPASACRRFVKFNGGVGEEQLRWLEGVLSVGPPVPAFSRSFHAAFFLLLWAHISPFLAIEPYRLLMHNSACGLTPPSCSLHPACSHVWNYDEVSVTFESTQKTQKPTTALPTATCLVWNYDEVSKTLLGTAISDHPQARVCGSSDSRARALRSIHLSLSSMVPLKHVEPVLATIHRHECVAAVIAGHAHFGAYALDARGIHHRILEGAVECPPGGRCGVSHPSPPFPTATIHRHECVAAVIAGHAHFGAYALDARGIHHRILEGAVECPPGTVAFGHVDVYPDRLCIIGTDRMLCTEMKFPSRSGSGADL